MLQLASLAAIIMVIIVTFTIVGTMGGIIYSLLYLINKSKYKNKKGIEIQSRKV